MKVGQIIGSILDTMFKILLVVVAVVFTYKYALAAYEFGYRVFAESPVSAVGREKVISISITKDATPLEIGQVLEDKGLIRDAELFYIQEFFSGHHGEMKEGIYELNSAMTPDEMIDIMCTGNEETEDS